MKKLLSALLITLVGVTVQAQNKPLACQDVAAGGLDWNNGRWVTTTFLTGKFILVLEGNTLTKESVGKVLTHANQAPTIAEISCTGRVGRISCNSNHKHLLFDPKTLKGGISVLLGSTNDDGFYKDSIYVKAFSCQPY
jgi:hypothetical protein